MACLCKYCARLNTGSRCLFCGSAFSGAAVRERTATAEAVAEEPIVPSVPSAPATAGEQKNPMAIAGFVLSVTGYFFWLGCIFSFIGLAQSKRRGGKGKGFAIAGIVISAITVISLSLLFAFVLLRRV